MIEINKNNFWNLFIVIAILVFIITVLTVFGEIYSAKNFCDKTNGEYHLNLENFNEIHTCDGQKIAKYTDGWRFYTNFKDFKVELPKS